MRLKGKVAVVTGSSSGIGEAVARAYAREGAKVVVTYNTKMEPATSIAREIAAELVCHLDVRDRGSIRACFQAAFDRYGRIDVLVNNAGVNLTADFDKQTDEEWDIVLDIDLKGPFRCCQEVLPFISDGGRIINIGSLSGEYGGPRTPSYACAKMGLTALTHNVARFFRATQYLRKHLVARGDWKRVYREDNVPSGKGYRSFSDVD